MFAKKVPQGYIAINRSSVCFPFFGNDEKERQSSDPVAARVFALSLFPGGNQRAADKKKLYSRKQQQSVDATRVSIDRNKNDFLNE